jgi:hypothetical protein
MPNWCNNQINIWGEGVTAVREILEENQGGRMFELLVGKLAEGQTESEYIESWYNTNCDRWGCKWDVDINMDDFFFEDGQIIMTIQTAWSPCNGFLKLLHEKYGVDCENDYNESGSYFAGRYTIDGNGEKDECYDYLEGLYRFDYDSFLYEIENLMEDELPPLEEWLKEFPFVKNTHDLETIYKSYN